LIAGVLRDREKCQIEILARLMRILISYDVFGTKRYTKVSEMPEYETWTYRLAGGEGFLPEIQTIWKKQSAEYQAGLAEGNPLAYLIRVWLGVPKQPFVNPIDNVGRRVTVSELFAEISELCRDFDLKQTYQSPAKFGTNIKNNMSEMLALGFKTNSGTGGSQRIWFEPSPEILQSGKEEFEALDKVRKRKQRAWLDKDDPSIQKGDSSAQKGDSPVLKG